MNILIKLMSIVALVIAPTIANLHSKDARQATNVPVKTQAITATTTLAPIAK